MRGQINPVHSDVLMPQNNGTSAITQEQNVSTVLEQDDIRRVIATPHHTPRRIREDIAEMLCKEIVFGEEVEIKDIIKFREKYGPVDNILTSLRSTEEWSKMKQLSKRSHTISILALKNVLDSLFSTLDTLFEKFTHDNDVFSEVPEDAKRVLKDLEEILNETLNLWNRKVNDSGPSGFIQNLTEQQRSDLQEVYDQIIERTIRKDISKFNKEMDKHADILELLALLYPGRLWDMSLSELHRQYFENLEKYASIMERNEDIKKIVEMLGKIELEYGSKRLAITSYGKSEIYSVTTSKSIEYMLPIELVKLTDETLELLFFSKYIDGKLLTYQLRGKYWTGGPPKKKRKGPVVALVDTSGSMSGAPETMAKAIVLAVAKKMLKEGRDVKVVLFSSTDQTIEIELTDRKKMANEFLSFLAYGFGGGTDFNTALRSGLDSLKEKKFKSADLLFITDGLSVLSDDRLVQEWNTFKAEYDTRVFTFIIGNDTAGGLEVVSDHTFIAGKSNNWDIDTAPSKMVKMMTMP